MALPSGHVAQVILLALGLQTCLAQYLHLVQDLHLVQSKIASLAACHTPVVDIFGCCRSRTMRAPRGKEATWVMRAGMANISRTEGCHDARSTARPVEYVGVAYRVTNVAATGYGILPGRKSSGERRGWASAPRSRKDPGRHRRWRSNQLAGLRIESCRLYDQFPRLGEASWEIVGMQ